jgi:hypothetical protein
MGRRTGLFNALPVLYWVYLRLLNQFGILTSTVQTTSGLEIPSCWRQSEANAWMMLS